MDPLHDWWVGKETTLKEEQRGNIPGDASQHGGTQAGGGEAAGAGDGGL